MWKHFHTTFPVEIEVILWRFGSKWANRMIFGKFSWLLLFVVFSFHKIPWSRLCIFWLKCWGEFQVLQDISKKTRFLEKIRQEEMNSWLLFTDRLLRLSPSGRLIFNWFQSNTRKYQLTLYCCPSFWNQYKTEGNMGVVFCLT